MGTTSKGYLKIYTCQSLTKKDRNGKQDKVMVSRSVRCKSEPKVVRDKPIAKATPKGKIPSEYRPYQVKPNKYFPDSKGHKTRLEAK